MLIFKQNLLTRLGLLIVITGSVLAWQKADAQENHDQARPNILWLTSEDNNVSWVGCYGNTNATTPNIDRLASEGFLYTHAFASAPVCAPSRSSWITGINAVSMGTHHMRSRYNIPHAKIKYYPDLLRRAGYYCSNYKKTDYNIGARPDKDCWNSNKLDWNKLKTTQPFFQVINISDSHESRAQGTVEHTQHNPAKTTLHKYHPDLPDMRKNYAKYHDAVENMDNYIGQHLAALEKAGLAENTIVIYNSDHGGVLPRSKRFLFDSGTHCPLIIKVPEKFSHLRPAEKPGSIIDRLVSFVDMPKTWLSLANAKIPDYMQGLIFLGSQLESEPEYHFSFRGRMDERNDNVRAVRGKRYLYIRNYMPYAPYGQKLEYLWKMRATQVWDEHHKNGKTDAITGRFFLPKASSEELYDTWKDPDNINNLIANPEFSEIALDMKTYLCRHQKEIFDAGLIPEADMVKRATDNNTTIYEMVRNPKLYDIDAYLSASDLALQVTPESLPTLLNYMKDSDSAIRYWGITGCFLLGDKATTAKNEIITLLNDSSHEVRAMAAWCLINLGDKERGLSCLKTMIESNSYAMLKILNIIDWMGADGNSLIPQVKNVIPKSNDKYIARMKACILNSAP